MKSEARENHGKYRNWISAELGMEWLRRDWAVYIEENETYASEIEYVKNETFRYPTEIPPF